MPSKEGNKTRTTENSRVGKLKEKKRKRKKKKKQEGRRKKQKELCSLKTHTGNKWGFSCFYVVLSLLLGSSLIYISYTYTYIYIYIYMYTYAKKKISKYLRSIIIYCTYLCYLRLANEI